jgi:Beta propeller domain
MVLAIALGLMAMVGLTAPSQGSDRTVAGTGLRGFEGKAALAAFVRKMRALDSKQIALLNSAPMSLDIPLAPALAESADASASESESITNTQEAGVDEGGIVKRAGDYLIVLRRGRLFTVRVGDDTLAPADMIDAFPPGKRNPGDTWYDEMLIHDRQVIVIGYSYGEFGTELNRFDMGADGSLKWRDTHYLRSGDYYSSSNYASRLIGDELVMYAPVYADWSALEDSLPALRGRDPEARPTPLVKPQDFLVAEPYRDGRYPLEVLHTVTRCDLSAPDFACRATAIAGTWSHAFYVSAKAVYAWTGTAETVAGVTSNETPGQLYRIPLDGSRPGAVQVRGAPVDQFSFAEDARAGVLRVLLRGDGDGEGMWAGEVSAGGVKLATVAFDAFGTGGEALPRGGYRDLPLPEGWRFHNRFIGDYVLYASGDYGGEDRTPEVYAVPLDGGAVQVVKLVHGISRFDRMGEDAVAIGPGRGEALGFSALSLGTAARVEDTYLLPAASEGETRSQAFVFRPDPASADGRSGILGLPIARGRPRNGGEFLGSGAAIAFLRRDARKFNPAGELAAAARVSSNDNCKASCVDWYGNARPIFLGDRIFALMGYELVEGTLAGGRIGERRRVSFAP